MSVCAFWATAGAQTDSIHTLNDVEVSHRHQPQGVSVDADGSVRIQSAALRKGVRNLGEADAIAVAEMLPGISSGGDYASGISVNGSDYAHNSYSYDGATVFFPYRFGGIFSDFNPHHINNVVISPSGEMASTYALGAFVSANTADYLQQDVGGALNLGVVASSATLRLPLADRTSVTASARLSYMDYLYGRLLTDGDNQIRYSFSDFNLTLRHEFSQKSVLKISALLSDDKLKFSDTDFVLDTRLKWDNAAVSVNYDLKNKVFDYKQLLTYSHFGSRLGLEMPQFSLSLPSSVSQCVVAGEALAHVFALDVGYRVEYNKYEPQYAVSSLHHDYVPSGPATESWLFSFGTTCSQPFATDHLLKVNSRSAYYISGSYSYYGLDRSISYQYSRDRHVLSAMVGVNTQFMHQVGFSDLGLASNFYLPALESIPPQESVGVDFNYTLSGASDRLSLSVSSYAKKLFNVAEYTGDVISVLSDGYDALDYVTTGDGYNIGGDVSFRYDTGILGGWAGYSLAVCRRKFKKLSQAWVPAANEPLHALKAFASWRLNSAVSLSAYFTLSSGRRYTPIKSVYIVGGNVIAEYGTRNSGHLPLYHRLDLSLTYNLPVLRFGARPLRSYVNFSLLNAYGHKNIEMQYYDYNEKTNDIQLRKISSVYRFFPSLSYSVDF